MFIRTWYGAEGAEILGWYGVWYGSWYGKSGLVYLGMDFGRMQKKTIPLSAQSQCIIISAERIRGQLKISWLTAVEKTIIIRGII